MTTVQSLPFIENGSVIDHIPNGRGMRLVNLLKLEQHSFRVSIGLHLPSPSLNLKDIIKIEGWHITPEDANKIAIIAPEATVSHVTDSFVEKKFQVTLPDTITKIVVCPNSNCITNSEFCNTIFSTKAIRGQVLLKCHHCQTLSKHEEILSYNL